MQTNWEVYAITALFAIPALLIFIKSFKGIGKSNDLAKGNDHTKIEKEGALSQERMKQIHAALKDFMIEKKPFLQKRYSISQLANDIRVPHHQVSAFINGYYEMNFNDYINQYRVAYSKMMLMNEEWKYKTLQGISAECGFGNRTTFHMAFKKSTGKNPSEFIQALKNGEAHDAVFPDEIERDLIGKSKEDNMLRVVRRAC
ncbi:MAG TPA: AraC family transcriptional regulator [Chitinophagaceae bacterium]|nr:AraC family transcriptional regulator [Chitinophagaceae bacterium]